MCGPEENTVSSVPCSDITRTTVCVTVPASIIIVVWPNCFSNSIAIAYGLKYTRKRFWSRSVSCLQSTPCEVMVGVIQDDMAICAAKSERVDAHSPLTFLWPNSEFRGNPKVPALKVNLGIGCLECRLGGMTPRSRERTALMTPAKPLTPSVWPILVLTLPTYRGIGLPFLSNGRLCPIVDPMAPALSRWVG